MFSGFPEFPLGIRDFLRSPATTARSNSVFKCRLHIFNNGSNWMVDPDKYQFKIKIYETTGIDFTV